MFLRAQVPIDSFLAARHKHVADDTLSLLLKAVVSRPINRGEGVKEGEKGTYLTGLACGDDKVQVARVNAAVRTGHDKLIVKSLGEWHVWRLVPKVAMGVHQLFDLVRPCGGRERVKLGPELGVENVVYILRKSDNIGAQADAVGRGDCHVRSNGGLGQRCGQESW